MTKTAFRPGGGCDRQQGVRRAPERLVWTAGLALSLLVLPAPGIEAQGLRPPPDPQQLQQPRRAPLTFTPTLTVTEEFNDNIFLNNDNREWDFITRFTPGLTLELEDPLYRLGLNYSFTADVFARHPDLDHAFDAHNLLLDGLYRATPRLTLTLTDTFTFDTNTNLISSEAVATGRTRAFSNALAGGAAYALDPRTTLRGTVSWTLLRFSAEELRDSDTYRAEAVVERTLTPRLTGSLGYELAVFDIEREEDVTAHTPRLGLTYRFTETLTGTLRAGPTFAVTEDGDTRVTPSVVAGLSQRFAWGALGVDYTRALGTAGGLGGVTVNQSIGATATVTTLMKGLVVAVGPRYSLIDSLRGREIDVDSFTLPVSATYRIAPWIAVVGSYVFFHQRSDSRITDPALASFFASDVDQNRVWVGVQFGYPIRFD